MQPTIKALIKHMINALFLMPILVTSASASQTAAKPLIDSWESQALKLQREIDLNAPLSEATFLATHNSYNSKAYEIPLTRYTDPNQLLSIYDQLEMGIRSIELDTHWSLNYKLSHDILLCHGEPNHLGCGFFGRPAIEGLQEIRDWIRKNPNEIILLYLERHLDNHEPRMAAELDQYLGDYIYKPSQVRNPSEPLHSCVSLPGTLTKADILKSGKQVLVVVEGCDGDNPPYEEQDAFPFQWNDYAFSGTGDSNTTHYQFLESTIDDFTNYPSCSKSTVYSPDLNHTSLWRMYEDRTMLSNIIHSKRKILPNELQELIRCGINWPAMDMLDANDPRLEAAIWSWAHDYPQAGQGQCAAYERGKGIINLPCNTTLTAFACQQASTHQLKAASGFGTPREGESTCQLIGSDWHFATPINGQQMDSLTLSMSTQGIDSIYLNYIEKNQDEWVANAYT